MVFESASHDEPYVALEVSATTNLFKSDTNLEHNIEFQQRMLEQVKADWQRQWDVPIVESSVRVVAINGIRTLVMDIVGEHKITLRSMVLFFDDGKTFAVVLVSAGDHASSEIAKVTNSITPNIKFGPQKALAATLDRKSPEKAQKAINSTSLPADAQSVMGVYKYTMPPGFPYPGTDTITLSNDGNFRYDMSLSRGKMATFLGTWSFSNGAVIAVLNERLVEGKPYPPTDENGWKPGSTMNIHIIGDKLYKSKTSKEPFTKVSN